MEYEKIGLRCGIEIHQRLDTKKLFCECSTGMDEEKKGEIIRRLRPVSGELGEIDPAAMYEYLRNKMFVYNLYSNETCLVEADEEPPHEVNKEALSIAFTIAKMLNCFIPDEIHVMRKTVIDGSNTGGFQRTMIVGLDGKIKTEFGTVKIPTVCLEEESARIEWQEGDEIRYKLSGLGIPLIEISTDASIKTPGQCLETALTIGNFLRSFKIKRGIGSIRQDINVSIKYGARVEIKGFQDVKNIPQLIDNEIKRQISLLEIKNELKNREAEFLITDATDVFEQTDCRIVKASIEAREKIFAAKLPFKGFMKRDVGGKTFGKELAYYSEAYGPKGLIHSEENLKKYGLEREFKELEKIMHIGKDDVIVIICGKNSKNAIEAVVERAKYCYAGVPEETRIALADNTTKYSRPLPGSNRMYPETDVPPIPAVNYVKSLKKVETIDEKRKRLEKIIPKELVSQIITSEYYSLFEELMGYDPVMVATTFVSYLKNLKRKGKPVEKIKKNDFVELFELVKNNIISKNAVFRALEMLTEGKKVRDIEKRFNKLSKEEIECIVDNVVKKNPGKKLSVLMGILVKKVEGRADGKVLAEMLKKKLRK